MTSTEGCIYTKQDLFTLPTLTSFKVCLHITLQKETNYSPKQVLRSWLAARKYFIISIFN